MKIIRWMVKTGDRIGMIQEVAQVFSHEGGRNKTRKRIAACKTDQNGSFSFPKLPKGK